jgi:hypothetical protein
MSVFEDPPTVRLLPLPVIPPAFVRRSIPEVDVMRVSPARVTVPDAVMMLLEFDNKAPLAPVVPVPFSTKFSATVVDADMNISNVAPEETVVLPAVVPNPLPVNNVKTPPWTEVAPE